MLILLATDAASHKDDWCQDDTRPYETYAPPTPQPKKGSESGPVTRGQLELSVLGGSTRKWMPALSRQSPASTLQAGPRLWNVFIFGVCVCVCVCFPLVF